MSSNIETPARGKTNRPHIAIVGAGIGGLALAIALAAARLQPGRHRKAQRRADPRRRAVPDACAERRQRAAGAWPCRDGDRRRARYTRHRALQRARQAVALMDYGQHQCAVRRALVHRPPRRARRSAARRRSSRQASSSASARASTGSARAPTASHSTSRATGSGPTRSSLATACARRCGGWRFRASRAALFRPDRNRRRGRCAGRRCRPTAS